MPELPPPPSRVAIARASLAAYPGMSPYHPSEPYPEYPFPDAFATDTNAPYGAVRDAFRLLGYDAERFGKRDWNPLGHLIRPGMTVFIKPNFVLSRHARGGDLWSIVTHPSVLRAVADYCWIALGDRGRIILGDAPQYDCNFEELSAAGGLEELKTFYAGRRGPSFELLDLRRYWSRWKHFPSLLESLPGDPSGSVRVNLDGASALESLPNRDLLYGAVYHREETIRHHTGGRHDYEISRTIMEADVVVSVPKLKVHKKVGVTLNIKGLVGTSTNKNLIVHYRVRPPSQGGDQFPDGLLTPVEQFLIATERWMYDHLLAPRIKPLEYLHRSIYWLHNHTTRKLGLKVDERKRVMDAGNWHGNDSAWRMAVDLLRLFYFADREGNLHDTPQRRTLSVIDGIIGGENNGPLTPDARAAGVIVAGENFVSVDVAATRLMGFDPLKLRTYQAIFADPLLRLGIERPDQIEVATDVPEWRNPLGNATDRFLGFRPHPGWIGHVEVDAPAGAR
ncbi:MAG: DUF362 domain-containing protein [Gemmatimonadetes bacterium]|nr:DUF362 domain-containing protein [Gemmatimonadota bacterium]